MKSTLLVLAVVWMHMVLGCIWCTSHPVVDLESRSQNVSPYE
jgi:hypothetical protein